MNNRVKQNKKKARLNQEQNRMKVSVILPFRNEEPYLKTCLLSLARQSGIAFQLIAVNDGSTDGSEDVFFSLAHHFPKAVYVKTKGIGLVGSLNLGIGKASGDFLARADGDDIYHPKRLVLQAQHLMNGADLVGSLTRFFPRRRIQGGFLAYERWINSLRTEDEIATEIFVENPLPHPSIMMKHSLIDKLGGYQEMRWPEDWDLVLRTHGLGGRIVKAADTLHFWRDHDDRLCRVHKNYSRHAFIRCRCHYLAQGPLADKRKVVIWGAGPIGRKMTTHLLDKGIPVEGFIDIDPKKIGRTVRDRPVHAPHFLEKNRFFVLGCVGRRFARYDIRRALIAMGYVEIKDFLLAS